FDEAGEALYNGGAASPDGTSITILGTGDNLVHSAIYQNAMTGSGYDFTPYYEYLKEFISSADIATVNQESPIATSILPVSGYPEFNTPEEAGYALLDAGFDVINEGNNHIMDQGTEGALATLDFWDSLGVPYVGFYRNEEDRDTIRVVERKGIKVAFLGIVEMLNYPLSDSNTCKVIWTKDEDRIRDLLTKASSMADVVVVHVHWGEENESEVEDHVTELAQKMVDWGADIIYGNHPHLLRDIEILTRESDGKKCPVAYSLGNFLNGQTNPWQVVSGLMTVTCVRNQVTGDVDPQYMSFLPVIMHYSGNRTNGRLYPICLYSSDMAASHGVARFGSSLSMSYIMNILEDKVPEEYRNRVGRIPN
ncbi:MAG: CapA family protein, partial [Eubacteriales bacterium]